MRELKFRVWMGKEMYFKPINIGDNFSGNGDEIFLQYTGLKDKNGKEIYDGDIIKKEYSPHKQWWIEQVFFANGAFMEKGIRVSHKLVWDSEIGDEECVYKEEGFPYNEISYIGFNNGVSNCEILGNIYENPELLTKD